MSTGLESRASHLLEAQHLAPLLFSSSGGYSQGSGGVAISACPGYKACTDTACPGVYTAPCHITCADTALLDTCVDTTCYIAVYALPWLHCIHSTEHVPCTLELSLMVTLHGPASLGRNLLSVTLAFPIWEVRTILPRCPLVSWF